MQMDLLGTSLGNRNSYLNFSTLDMLVFVSNVKYSISSRLKRSAEAKPVMRYSITFDARST